MKDPTGLVLILGVVGLELMSKDPFAGDHVGARGRGTWSHVWLASMASYSIACYHTSGVGERATDRG
jgi:Na+/proline symporter